MKKLIITAIISSAIAAPTMASNNPGESDIGLIFNIKNHTDMPKQVEKLSSQEMKDTQGEYGNPGAIAGGIIGGAAYVVHPPKRGGLTQEGFITSVGEGALIGATSSTVILVNEYKEHMKTCLERNINPTAIIMNEMQFEKKTTCQKYVGDMMPILKLLAKLCHDEYNQSFAQRHGTPDNMGPLEIESRDAMLE